MSATTYSTYTYRELDQPENESNNNNNNNSHNGLTKDQELIPVYNCNNDNEENNNDENLLFVDDAIGRL